MAHSQQSWMESSIMFKDSFKIKEERLSEKSIRLPGLSVFQKGFSNSIIILSIVPKSIDSMAETLRARVDVIRRFFLRR
jgi:hypothetical protein